MGADLILTSGLPPETNKETMSRLDPDERFERMKPLLPPGYHLYDPYGDSHLNRLGLSWLEDIKPIAVPFEVWEGSSCIQVTRALPLTCCATILARLQGAEVQVGEIPISSECRERLGVVVLRDVDPERVVPPPLPFTSITMEEARKTDSWRHEAIAFFELAIRKKEMPQCTL